MDVWWASLLPAPGSEEGVAVDARGRRIAELKDQLARSQAEAADLRQAAAATAAASEGPERHVLPGVAAYELVGRRALVVGTAAPHAAAAAAALAAAGADVVVAATSGKMAGDEAASRRADATQALVVEPPQDASKGEVARLEHATFQPRADVVVLPLPLDGPASVAGGGWPSGTAAQLTAVHVWLHAATRSMKERGYGRVILVREDTGRAPGAAALRGALDAAVEAYADDLTPHGVTVNVLAASSSSREAIAHALAGPLVMLASDAGAGVTGQQIRVSAPRTSH